MITCEVNGKIYERKPAKSTGSCQGCDGNKFTELPDGKLLSVCANLDDCSGSENGFETDYIWKEK